MNEHRPLLTFDRIAIGETYADRQISVSATMVAAYAGAVGAHSAPAYLMAASWTVPRVSFSQWTVPPGGIHARQTWRGYQRISAGATVRLRTTAKEKYHAKSRPYVVFESVIESADGVRLASGEMTILWPA